ncbi:MAG: guanylate kinase [Rhizobiales bacterium]|nr:guanylate kinase [Hyphomicrobiales bacterium]
MSAPSPPKAARRGVMLVLSSPSGAGKSTITRYLLEQEKGLTLSISATTRPRRHSEIEGVHYFFVDRPRFEAMQRDGELLESALVHGNMYGTPRDAVEKALDAGLDVLFDIDWQGTQQLKRAMGDDVATIFVLPPSFQELRSRLERRAEDQTDIIARRLVNARTEIGHWTEYDYVIVNSDLDASFNATRTILAAERARREKPPRADVIAAAAPFRRDRQPGLPAFIGNLLAEGAAITGSAG